MLSNFAGYMMGEQIYLDFDNIYSLCEYIFPESNEDMRTILCDESEAIKIMKELLSRQNVNVACVDIDAQSYDGEYLVSLMRQEDGEYGLYIESAYADDGRAKYSEGIILCSMKVPYQEYIDGCHESVRDGYQRFILYHIIWEVIPSSEFWTGQRING